MPHALPYPPDDDVTARTIVAEELRHPNHARWRTMTSDPYILQTYRALCALDRDLDATFAARRASLDEAQAAYHAHRINAEERARARADYERWKANALIFRNKVHDRRDQLIPRVRTLRGDTSYQHVRDSYLALAGAVAQHRTALATSSPTQRDVHDRLLWTLLDHLTITVCRTAPDETLQLIPLTEAIRQHCPPQ